MKFSTCQIIITLSFFPWQRQVGSYLLFCCPLRFALGLEFYAYSLVDYQAEGAHILQQSACPPLKRITSPCHLLGICFECSILSFPQSFLLDPVLAIKTSGYGASNRYKEYAVNKHECVLATSRRVVVRLLERYYRDAGRQSYFVPAPCASFL